MANVSITSTRKKAPARLEHSSQGRVRVRVPSKRRSHRSTGRMRGAADEFLEIVEESGDAGKGEVGITTAVGLVKALDRRVQEMTGHRLRLRLLVPATFFGLGIRTLIVDGLTVGSMPWFVLVYFGIDSFLKLYPEHAPAKKA